MKDEPTMYWFKFFPAEFLSSPEVQALTLEQQGALLRLWCCYFRLRDNLPADLETVSRMTQVPAEICALLLGQFFTEDDDGTWFSDKLQKELEASLGRSDKGKKAADARWRKRRKSPSAKGKGRACKSNASALPEHPPQDPPEQCHIDSDSDLDLDPDSTPQGSVGSPPPGTSHSEVGGGGGELSLSGSDRRVGSYASTSGPQPAGEILRAAFRGRAS